MHLNNHAHYLTQSTHNHVRKPNQMHVQKIMHDSPYLSHGTITPIMGARERNNGVIT